MDIENMLRRDRGLRIATAKRIKAVGPVWVVPSESHSGSYVVNAKATVSDSTCSCADFELRQKPCKHVFAVQFVRRRIKQKGSVVTNVLPVTYAQNWNAYSSAQCSEKDIVQLLLKGLCSSIVAPEQHRGRPRLPLSDVVFAATMKVYGAMSGRRTSCDILEAKTKGHIEQAPHYNSISLYLGKPELTPILRALVEESALPLKAVENVFAIDATGFSTSVYHRWYDHKWGRKRKSATWLKVHAMVGVKTNIITSIDVTAGHVNDSPQFTALVRRTAQNFTLHEVSADKAYLGKKNLDVVEEAGGTPFIPFKRNSKPNNHPSWERLWHLFHHRKGEFQEHYHRRSNAESAFSAIKRLFGGHLRSKKHDSQTNELLCKILAYNLTRVVHAMFALDVTPDFLATQS